MTREEKIAAAEAKFRREQKIAMAQTKWDSENMTSDQINSAKAGHLDIVGPAQAFTEGVGQAGTLGYLPQLQAAAEPLTDRLFNAITGKDVEPAPLEQMTGGAGYVQARDANIERLRQQEAEHPIASTAGQVTGSLASSALIPGGAGGGLLARLGRGAATGAGLGLISNPGDEKGLVGIQPAKRIENALSGGLLGAAGQGVAEGVGALKNVITPEALKKIAGEKAFKAVGPYQRDVLTAKMAPEKIGQKLLEEKVVRTLPASYDKLAKRSNEALEKVGSQLDDYLNKIADAAEKQSLGMATGKEAALKGANDAVAKAGIDRAKVADSLRQDLLDTSGIPGVSKKNALFEDLIDEFEKGTPIIDIKSAQKMKQATGDQINWRRLPHTDTPNEELFYRKLYDKLREGVEDAADAGAAFLGPNAKKDYIDLKEKYGALKTAAKIANERSGREFANRYISLSDYQSGQTGAALGAAAAVARGGSPTRVITDAVIGSLVGSITNKGARRFGNQVAARAAMKVAEALEGSSDLQKKYLSQLAPLVDSPEKLVNALYRISKDPEYSKGYQINE